MPTSNGFKTPSMPAMADVGSNRSLTASIPSPATIPEPGSAKIGGTHTPSKLSMPKPVKGVGQRTLPGALPGNPVQKVQQMQGGVPANPKMKQQRMQAIQNYVARLGSGKAEAPGAFLQSIAHMF
jgi:hypothetical protein